MRNLAVIVFLLIPLLVISQSKNDFMELDNTIKSWISNAFYPGASICIVKNNQVVFNKSYGNHHNDTEVYVASAGKWIAAATIAAVVDKTDLCWEDPAEKWIPELEGNSQGKVKLRQLLSHTSGIVPYLPEPHIDTFNILSKSIEYILKLDTVCSPGKKFQYGGLGMQIAGRMAEMAFGQDFETIFQKCIAIPLGMKKSHFIPINLDGGHTPMLGGGLRTTLNDYIKFLEMIYNEGDFKGKLILKKETVNYMQKDHVGTALVSDGEYIQKSLGQIRKDIYGLGEWREKVDSNGNVYQISSPGWAGTYPWINKKDCIYGIFITHVEGNAAPKNNFSPFYNAVIISELTSKIIQTKNSR